MQFNLSQSSRARWCAIALLMGLWGGACSDPDIIDAPTTDATTDVRQGCQANSDCEHQNEPGSCTEWICDQESGQCQGQSAAYGTPCGDPNDCVLGICINGECNTESLFNCDDGNPCTDDVCGDDGQCQSTPNQGSCIPDHPCSSVGQCQNGACFLSEYTCPSCTQDSDCTPLTEGDKCIGTFVCNATTQQCERTAGSQTICTADSPCMSAACDPNTGLCVELPRPDGWVCHDGDICTLEDRCVNGVCTSNAGLICPSQESTCLSTTCNPTSGCTQSNLSQVPCDDGSGCTGNDTCQDGLCVGDLGDVCECASDGDCQPFEDDNQCNGRLRCEEGGCQIDPTSIVQCAQPAAGCQVAHCVPSTGECTLKNTTDITCSDGNLCTQDDTCVDGGCKGTPYACNDNNTCTVDSCLPAEGCVYQLLDECGPNCNVAAGKQCSPGDTQDCGTGGSQECTTNCQWGLCAFQGTCTAGHTQSCGNCGAQTCGNDNEWGTCLNQGACAAGQTQSCENGGTQSCTVGCDWGPCQGGGACENGASQVCGFCGTQTCTADNQWGACQNQGVCELGETQPCGNGGLQTCSASCQWGSCQGEGVCAAGATKPCGNCGTQTCNANNQWAACQNQGACSPGQSQGCGTAFCDVCSERSCTSQCEWATECVLSGQNKCEWKEGTNWQYCGGGTVKWQFCLKPEQLGTDYCGWAPCQPKPE